jgi:iron complex outermembrane receptor protein
LETQASAADNSTFPLPEIVVSGKRIDAPPTIIMREVSEEDISAWNAHTTGDALTYVPGVNVQVGGSSGDSRAWIRGFRDRDVLVLYDGIPVASGFEGTIDLNEISLEAVSYIKVMKSAPSVIYGTNGMGGVIDVIPKTGVNDEFLNGGLEFGSDDRLLVRANGGGGNGNISYFLSGTHQQADDYGLSDDYSPQSNQPAGTRVNSDFKRNNLFFRFDTLDTIIGHASMFFNISDAEKGLPIETGVDDPDFARLTQSTRTTVGLSNQFSAIPLTVKLYYNGYKSDLTFYNDDTFSEVDEVESAEDYSLGSKLYSTFEAASNNVLLLSGSVQKDVFKGEGELENGDKAELTTWTLALEDEYWINDRLSLAAGAIYTYFDQTRLDQSSSAINPQIALAWQTSDALSLHASIAQRTRFPKLRELYRRRYGNPDLREQTANNYELGVKFQHNNGLSSDFSIFRSDIDDLIERLDRRSLYENLDRVTLSGMEMSSGGWASDSIFCRLSYTYVDAAEDLQGGGSRQLRSRPKHTAMLELRYRSPWEMMFSANGIYVSGLHDLDADDNYTNVSSYFVGNVRASWPFADRWEAYVSISNLFDENYQHRLGDPREGRAFVLGLDFGF